MKFIGTEIRQDGKPYGVTFDAEDWEEARCICNDNGWFLDGELHAVIPASAAFGAREADALVAALNEAERAVKQ